MEKLRLILFVDMPSSNRHERKESRLFREALFRQGFSELQEGVYSRVADGRTNAELHEKRVRQCRPDCGRIRFIAITERQFQAGTLLVGDEGAQEAEIDSQLDIFL